MANVKTAISLKKTLFDQVDSLASEMNIPRSRLFVLALEEFILRYQNKQLLEQINQAYPEDPDLDEQVYLQQMKTQHRKIVEGEW